MSEVYQSQPATASQRPISQLATNRGLIKFIILSVITLGIYSVIFFSGVSDNINAIASRYDGKKTMHFCLVFFLVGPITFEIASLVWFHNMSARIGSELKRRGIDYSFGAGTFWIWNVLGLLILVGPFIYVHKLCTAMNKLAENYNVEG